MHWDCDSSWFSNVHVDFWGGLSRISCEKNTFAGSGKVIGVSTELVPASCSYSDTGKVPGS